MAKFSILATLGLDSKKFKTGAEGAQKSGGKLTGFLKGAFVAGFVAAGAAIVAFVGKGIKDFIEMEKKAREVFTLIPDASEDMRKQLVAGARDIAKEYGVPVTDALQGMYDALSAGIPKENVVDFLKVASDAAKGGVASLGDAVGAITTVINGYGMEAKQARDVSDVLFTTVKTGVTTFTELGANVGKVTPIAAALGVSFEEVGAMFADLTAKLGKGKTAEAGTQINAMLAELAKSGSVADKAFKSLTGTSFPEFIKSGGSVKDAMLAIKQGADQSGKGMIDMFGSIEAGKGALALVKDEAAGLTKALEAQQERFGATKQAADEMKQSFADKLAVAMEKVKDIARRVGEVLMNLGGGSGGIFDMLIGYVSNLVGYFEKFSAGGKKSAGIMDMLGSAMKFAVKVAATQVNGFRMLIGVFELLINILGSVGRVYKAIFDPVFQITKSAAVIIAEFAKAVAAGFSPDAWWKFKDTVGKELGNVTDSFKNWGTNVNNVMKEESKNMENAWDDFGATVKDAVKEIGDIWDETGNWEFLDAEKMKAKEMAQQAEDAKKIAEEQKAAREESERAAELAKKQAKLLQERMEKIRKMKEVEEQIKKNMERMKELTERTKMLQAKKVELAKAEEERQKKIKELIKGQATVHNDALGILDKLAQKTNLRFRDEQRIKQLREIIAKKAQLANDATEEGLKKLKAHRDALILIKETEIERVMKVKGLTREQAEEEVKRSKTLQQIDKGLAGTNNRIKKAIEHQKGFNKAVPPAVVQVGKVKMNAQQLNAEIGKCKREQQNLTAKTKESVAGFKEMGGEAKEIEEGLRQVGEEMDSMKFGVDDMKLDMSDAEKLPEHLDSANDKLDAFNEKSKENELVKLANAGTIDIKPSSPIPVKVDDLKLDTKALNKMSQGTKELLNQAKQQTRSLKSIDKTVKGYFVNQ